MACKGTRSRKRDVSRIGKIVESEEEAATVFEELTRPGSKYAWIVLEIGSPSTTKNMASDAADTLRSLRAPGWKCAYTSYRDANGWRAQAHYKRC
jgi:hypothetical protein